MAEGQVKRIRTHKRHGENKTSKPRKRSEDDRATTKSVTAAAAADRPADIEALRKARLEYLSKSPEEKRKEMKYEYVKKVRTVSHRDTDKERHRKVVRDQKTEREPPKTWRRSARRTDDDRDHGDDEYVYAQKVSGRDTAATRSGTNAPEPSPSKRSERRRMPERRHTAPARREESHDEDAEDDEDHGDPASTTTRHRRRSEVERIDTLPRRSTVSVEKPSRPPLKRSATTATPRTVVSETATKTASLFSGILLPKSSPTRKVSCLTCGADDVPVNQSAKLPCTHRMCHSCLKRIFTMSVKDPAHMPPRCCTDQHIDLKHVDKLFDQKFKVLWNRRYAEFKTKNRIYCPTRKCGAWIKPAYITKENGRKVGRCKQCKTRVCGVCSQKMHTSRDCPKDPETKAFVEVAKQKGWQRCYSCSAMVELKEGCNHMTCRCTAEFCMVCGLKWKSCDCPWFNYEAVDAQLGGGGDPLRYQQEVERRQHQVERDEALARRMQQMGLFGGGGDEGVPGAQDPDGGGYAYAGVNRNFMQQAREALTANYANAEQAARGLLNGYGFVMGGGRGNHAAPPNGMPDQMMMEEEEMLGQAPRPGRDPAEEEDRPVRRRVTARQRNVAVDAVGGHYVVRGETDEERRIRDWANSVPA